MQNDFMLPAGFSLDVPNFGDYFSIWCIEENTFRSIVNRYQGINLHAHINSATASERVSSQNKSDLTITKEGIALFAINGPMMKSVGSMSDGTSTVRMRQQIRAATKSADVVGGFLQMDTPGGTVRGNQDLADEVAAFVASGKPMYVFVEDMTASAGVSIASQATKRFANNASALYGSMGTYAVLEDLSGRAEQLGVKVHLIKAGEFKGMGLAGTEVTAAHIEEAQRIVNSLNENYLGLIARGLNKSLDTIRAFADGRIHTAAVAVNMGLLDGIQTADETYSQLVAATLKSRPTPVTKGPKMEKQAATLAELKATFPKSVAEWRESQLEAGASLPEAAVAYAAHVEAKADAAQKAHAKELEDVRAEVKKPGTVSLGNPPVTNRGRTARVERQEEEQEGDEYIESGDAIEDFNAAVARVAGPRPDFSRRQRAVRTVASRDPNLYQAFLLATNPGKKQNRLITEKLESFVK